LFNVQIIKIPGNEDIPLPVKMSSGSSGFDLHAAVKELIQIQPREWKLIPTGIAISMSNRLEAQVRPRSGLALKHGITLLNSPGTIDADYRGEIGIILFNVSERPFQVERGDRVAQLVFQEIPRIEFQTGDVLNETLRGSGGFGHTGK
jgi:dUTP pyrophosphatase